MSQLPGRLACHEYCGAIPHQHLVRTMQILLRRRLVILSIGFLGAALPAALLAQSPDTKTQSVEPRSDQVVLAPGDSVRVVVWRKPELSGDFIIAPDGSITHPLY